MGLQGQDDIICNMSELQEKCAYSKSGKKGVERMKRLNYKEMYEKERRSSDRIFWLAIILLTLIGISSLTKINLLNNRIEQLPPQNLGSTYYDAHGSAWIRFDLSNQNQVILVKQIETICKNYDMANCMNSLDRLGVRK